eukprot:CAMPEP_0113482872 /NCGR_PEP_ID=MMETSP0014_2-20120614/23143_1 /TAXON_ID=2857 /ORGANISM="Nitzschia sp." /LENGTH=571 /DNA_ID=CAMNT_0000376403 /DNA_START=48 /DNA_END=1760 /DNA_ORIENTATION=- /assembly_acc=CAM_ASM_000159
MATTAKPYKDDPELGQQEEEEEQTSLLAGYGSTSPDEYTKNKYQKQYGIYSDNVDSKDVDVIDGTLRNKVHRVPKWVWLTSGLALYVCTIGAAWTHQRESGARLVLSDNKQEIFDIELMGKAKKSKKDKKKKHLKGGKKKEKKAPFEPVVYPGCAGYVDIKYVREPLAFKEHEAAAAAADCHLASIHNLDENTKYSKSGLFKMSYGPEIGQSFMSGKPLEKEFWLGGTADKHGEWSWTDKSDWGEPELALAGLKDPKKGQCLTSKFSFLEIAMLDIPTAGHWKAEDCKKPLPAIYKCCVPTPAPTSSPTNAPTANAVGETPGIETGVTPGVVPGQTPGVKEGFVPGVSGVAEDVEKEIDDAADAVVETPGVETGVTPGVVPGQTPGVEDLEAEADTADDVEDEPEASASADDSADEEEAEPSASEDDTADKEPASEGDAAVVPGETPGFVPGETPGVVPGYVPGETGAAKAKKHKNKKTKKVVGQTPGVNPGETPGVNPGDTPGVVPGVVPGETGADVPPVDEEPAPEEPLADEDEAVSPPADEEPATEETSADEDEAVSPPADEEPAPEE